MKVITLNKSNFEKACDNLAEKLLLSGDFATLVGVRTGGAIVANIVYNNLKQQSENVKYFEVDASRYGTITKNTNSTRMVFKFLPQAVLNVLRISEHYLVWLRMKLFKNVERSISFDIELTDYLKSLATGRVCIIDDAIDSGSTIKNILDKCYSINPQLDYTVAVLVVTQSKPVILPDIFLYRNVLLRFPWSNDFKS